MADFLTIACPECGKQMKAPAELAGKKVRCKACGEVFPVSGSPAKAAPQAAPKAAPKAAPQAAPPPKPSRPDLDDFDEEMGDGKPYDVTTTDLGPRCPECPLLPRCPRVGLPPL